MRLLAHALTPKGKRGTSPLSAVARSLSRFCPVLVDRTPHVSKGRTRGRVEANRITRRAARHGCNPLCELVDWLNIEVRELGQPSIDARKGVKHNLFLSVVGRGRPFGEFIFRFPSHRVFKRTHSRRDGIQCTFTYADYLEKVGAVLFLQVSQPAVRSMPGAPALNLSLKFIQDGLHT